MTTVREHLLPRTRVDLYVAGVDGVRLEEAEVDGVSVSPIVAHTDEAGFWEASLVPSATITPAGTVWARVQSRGGVQSVEYGLVPASGSILNWEDILVDPPGSIVPTGLTEHAAKRGYGGHLPDEATDSQVPTWDEDEGTWVAKTPEVPDVPVVSVNAKIGAVVLDASDVGADATGTAAGLVDAEETARTAADASLASDLADEEAARTQADLDEEAARVQAVADEATARTAAIADEADLRTQGDTDAKDRANHTGSQAIGTVSGLQAALDAKEATANRNAPDGYAGLSGGLLDITQIPDGIARDTEVATAVQAAIDALTNGASSAADTLGELGDLLGDADAAIAGLVTALGTKANADASNIVAATWRSALGLILGTDIYSKASVDALVAGLQPHDADLDALAGAGNSATLAAVTAAFTTAMATKLAGIATGATANLPDATLLDRTNHTGSQPLSTISDAGTAAAAALDVDSTFAANSDTRVASQKATKTALGLKLDTSAILATAGTVLHTSKVTGDANPRFNVYADGKMEWGPGNAAPDTNLYRAGVNVLKTDTYLRSGLNLRAMDGATAQTTIGSVGPAGESAILLGSGLDTNLYRSAADTLKTDDGLVTNNTLGITALSGPILANNGWIGANTSVSGNMAYLGATAGSTAGPGIALGTGLDTNLYRSAANILKTDDQFQAVSFVVAMVGTANQVTLGAVGGGTTGPGLQIGLTGDTNLYRNSANVLRTSGGLRADEEMIARNAGAAQVSIGAAGAGSTAGIAFGSANDTSLYRSGANTLKTGGVVAANQFILNAGGTAYYDSVLQSYMLYDGTGTGVCSRLLATTVGRIPLVVQGASGQTADLQTWTMNDGTTHNMKIDANGFLKWGTAARAQTTVGAAGGASALPATPTKYLQVKDSAGTTLVIPAYAAV